MLQTALQMQTEVPGYFLLLPGVFLSGLIFDRGAGIFAAVIAVGVGAYIGSAGGFGLDFLATNSLFAITAAGTAIVAEFQRAELRRVMLADKTKAVLLQEMAHRTKNNLAILSGMIRLEARHGGAEAAAALEAARRLQVMAEVYDHLSLKEDSRSVNMRYFLTEVVDKVFQSLAPSGPVAFKVLCEDIDLPNSHALAIGMIANELVTNALKYAFPGDRPGNVVISLSKRDGIELSASDNGIGLQGSTDPGGLGSRIVQLLAQQLDGEIATNGWTRACASGCGRIRVSGTWFSLRAAARAEMSGRAEVRSRRPSTGAAARRFRPRWRGIGLAGLLGVANMRTPGLVAASGQSSLLNISTEPIAKVVFFLGAGIRKAPVGKARRGGARVPEPTGGHLLKFAQTTTDPVVAAGLVEKATDLKERAEEHRAEDGGAPHTAGVG
ncbi:sensor histidine kinase [Bradyrhizobium sp. 15]|uniref:sensor histidine kinase n=1 Tax=Bradyrhizobium sp. 15 TaxID=2782633 RepID=UPI001FFBC106|nr:sensor histidine kinase [Bradyrhizobium sp. 15]